MKTLNNFELNSMEELKDFMGTVMDGLQEIEILNLSVEEMIEIYNLNFSSVEDFALYYSRIKSEARLFNYLEKNPITNKVDIKEECKVNINDVTKVKLFFDLLAEYHSIDDAKSILNDIDGTLFKFFNYRQAQEQMKLYRLALRYGKVANLRIHSAINLYKMLEF